jgi:hypothetical protein
VIGELCSSENRQPTERKRVEGPERRSEYANIVFVEEQSLPYVNAVRQHTDMRYRTGIEYAANT